MSEPGSQTLLAVQDLKKSFRQGGEVLHVLSGASFYIEPGEIVALVGPSGAGKSTLLQTVGLLDREDSGRIVIGGRPSHGLSERERTRARLEMIGFVYQFHYLQPEFSALENVVIPQMIAGQSRKRAHERAEQLLIGMGLGERLHHRPARLSGGEQQRVAIARALANAPKLVLADEPTGNLDPGTANVVFNILLEQVRETGLGALIATHNMDLAERMDRILELRAGRVQGL